MAAPPSLNLLGELRLIIRITAWSWSLLIVLGGISFIRAGYSLFIYTFSQHGGAIRGIFRFNIINSREHLLLALH
jgi:NADH-ubiquinone oxidoreductase chain 4